jgi:predicted component of type VI protein secretion system
MTKLTQQPNTKRKYQKRTQEILRHVSEILNQYKGASFTVRQLYYQLVSKGIIANTISSYKRLSRILSNARKEGVIPFEAIVDRTRTPIKAPSWDGLKSYLKGMKQKYKKSKWKNQKHYVEVWLEKDALRNIVESVTQFYDVYLIIGRGYPSLTLLYEAAERFKKIKKPIWILYLGDHDPSGLDIHRSIKENLIRHFGIKRKNLHLRKVAITLRQIKKFKLPPSPTKSTDLRTKKFLQKYGNSCVELDALPREVLEEELKKNIEKLLNNKKFKKRLKVEEKEVKKLKELIEKIEKEKS